MAAWVLGPERLRNGREPSAVVTGSTCKVSPSTARDPDALTDLQIGIAYGVPNFATDEDLAFRREWRVNDADLAIRPSCPVVTLLRRARKAMVIRKLVMMPSGTLTARAVQMWTRIWGIGESTRSSAPKVKRRCRQW